MTYNEHFTPFQINIPNSLHVSRFYPTIVAFLLAVVIIYPTMGMDKPTSWACIFVLFVLFYVLVSTMSGENLSNELPSTLYPLPPRGTDGISTQNYMAGMQVRNTVA